MCTLFLHASPPNAPFITVRSKQTRNEYELWLKGNIPIRNLSATQCTILCALFWSRDRKYFYMKIALILTLEKLLWWGNRVLLTIAVCAIKYGIRCMRVWVCPSSKHRKLYIWSLSLLKRTFHKYSKYSIFSHLFCCDFPLFLCQSGVPCLVHTLVIVLSWKHYFFLLSIDLIIWFVCIYIFIFSIVPFKLSDISWSGTGSKSYFKYENNNDSLVQVMEFNNKVIILNITNTKHLWIIAKIIKFFCD